MAETIIELDEETIQAIEQFNALMDIAPAETRKPGEFTRTEFAMQNRMTVKQSEHYLEGGVIRGVLTKRRAKVDGRSLNLYRIADA